MTRLLYSDIIDSQPDILQKHLAICLDFILDQVTGVTAVLLGGGYGRGEGTWIKEHGLCAPYNDYDFVVVVDSQGKGAGNNLKTLNTTALALSLGISWVDIDIIPHLTFRRMKHTVKNYDILHGSTVIYGDEDIIAQAKNILPSHITTRDLRRFYYTRSYAVLCALPRGKKLNEVNLEEMRFFRNQLAKGFLAVQDCELLAEYKFYCSSYVNRTAVYSDQSNNLDKINWFKWALQEKLDPCNNHFDLDFGYAGYAALIDFYQIDMNKFMGKYFYGISVTLENFEFLELTRPSLLAKYILSKVSRSHEHFKKERVLDHLRYILINTWPGAESSVRYETHLPKIKRLIAEIEPNACSDPTWGYVQNLVRELH
jgi:hypothetical protein